MCVGDESPWLSTDDWRFSLKLNVVFTFTLFVFGREGDLVAIQ